MSDLVAQLVTAPVPAFGAENELGQFHDSLEGAVVYPLVLGGQVYLMRLGHATHGYRVFSDSILILYALRDGKLEPVGSAIVQQGQGTLESVRALSPKP